MQGGWKEGASKETAFDLQGIRSESDSGGVWHSANDPAMARGRGRSKYREETWSEDEVRRFEVR